MLQLAMSSQVQMLLISSNSFFSCRNKRFHCSSFSSSVSAVNLNSGKVRLRPAQFASPCLEESRERISKLIHKPEISISPYDTAWVAMVPSPNSEPCFPDTLEWILQNQCPDGSWAQPHHHSLLQKDVISSTLACILALKRWNIAHHHVNRGIHFIESNFTSITGKDQIAPMGFDIIFTGMLEYAKDLSIDLTLEPRLLNDLIRNRNVELKRWGDGKPMDNKACVPYLSEGIGKLQDWDLVMTKYQRKNGSLFNSPSTTAAACIFHHNDDGCLDYLHSALKTFGYAAVPAIYPLNTYTQLCTIDNLERLEISQNFRKDIQSVLDDTYRCWLRGDEEIFMDASTCALAFRILRENGYDITSDQINGLLGDGLSNFPGVCKRDIYTTLELYRASEIFFPDEPDLEKHNLSLKHTLEQELSHGSCYSSELGRSIRDEVKHALQHPAHAIIGRVANRRNIEHYDSGHTRILKTSICSLNFGSKDFLLLSVADFNKGQRLHQEELKELERWVIENRLDELKFARQKSAYCYLSTTSFHGLELSDVRIEWAKASILVTVVDDFFDIGGSLKELNDLVDLVEAWDVDIHKACSSQAVLILFSAFKNIVHGVANKALVRQDRDVRKHIIDIWLEMLYSMLREAEWARDGHTPSMDEYMNNGYVSFGLGPIVLPIMYLAGPKLSEDMIQHPDCMNLFKLMSNCGRLLNDMRSYERESKQSKKNAVSLYMMNGGAEVTEEEAVAAVKRINDCNRRELRRLVLDEGIIPRACKDLFWNMSIVVHEFYIKDDGYTKEEFMKVVKNIIYEPIVLGENLDIEPVPN